MSTNLRHSEYDVIVIGGGHAGCEAALAASRLGRRVLLLTLNPDHTAQMSCNPAVGGIAKGQLVCEIDALGGEMGVNADAATIQFRMLNRSKGPAVWSPRAQCDKMVYQYRMKWVLEHQPNLAIQQAHATHIHTTGDRIYAVGTPFGQRYAKAVVLATGTFLQGNLHYGDVVLEGGRAGDSACNTLTHNLRNELNLRVGRLKTGTPPRVLAKSIDFNSLQRQSSDSESRRFSFRSPSVKSCRLFPAEPRNLPCYLTTSTKQTAEIVNDNLHTSAMYGGHIDATGTRYCPSFEDKIVRFPQRDNHQIYLEPEGTATDEYYVNGLSTSLPPTVQEKLLHSIPGLERAETSRYGYAIAYDFVYPYQLNKSLAVHTCPNLFLAGQINGTSGYEEAAAQGLIAGINAARYANNEHDAFVLQRDQAYIGVLIDDLTTKEITEPYRMFTSRAENRLTLRQDNADRRLMPLGHTLGLIPKEEYSNLCETERIIAETKEFLAGKTSQGTNLWDLMCRYGYTYSDFADAPQIPPKAMEQLNIEAHYQAYIQRERKRAAQLQSLQTWKIPSDFNYDIPGIRTETQQKLQKKKPDTLAQAAAIDAVTPAEISLLQVYLTRHAKQKTS